MFLLTLANGAPIHFHGFSSAVAIAAVPTFTAEYQPTLRYDAYCLVASLSPRIMLCLSAGPTCARRSAPIHSRTPPGSFNCCFFSRCRAQNYFTARRGSRDSSFDSVSAFFLPAIASSLIMTPFKFLLFLFFANCRSCEVAEWLFFFKFVYAICILGKFSPIIQYLVLVNAAYSQCRKVAAHHWGGAANHLGVLILERDRWNWYSFCH